MDVRQRTEAGVVRYNVVTGLACLGGFVLLESLAGASLEVVGTMVRVMAWIVTFVLVTRVVGQPLDAVEPLVRWLIWLAAVLAALGLAAGGTRQRSHPRSWRAASASKAAR